MATCCDAIYNHQGKIEKPPVIKLFKKAEIPYKAYFSFNNKHICKQPETSGRMFSREQDDWETSTISFDHFFDEANKASSVKLELSIEIVQKCNITHAQLPEFVRRFTSQWRLRKRLRLRSSHRNGRDLTQCWTGLIYPTTKSG